MTTPSPYLEVSVSLPTYCEQSDSPSELAMRLRAFHRAGIDHVSLYIQASDQQVPAHTLPLTTAHGLEQLAPVLTALRKLESSARGDTPYD